MSELLACTCVCIRAYIIYVCVYMCAYYICMHACVVMTEGGPLHTVWVWLPYPQIQKKKHGHCFGMQLCSVSVHAVMSVFCPFSFLISHCLFIAMVVVLRQHRWRRWPRSSFAWMVEEEQSNLVPVGPAPPKHTGCHGIQPELTGSKEKVDIFSLATTGETGESGNLMCSVCFGLKRKSEGTIITLI